MQHTERAWRVAIAAGVAAFVARGGPALAQESAGRVKLARGEEPGWSSSAAPSGAEEWQRLATEPYRGKQDDICFVSRRTGWYVNGAGKIFRTDDAGDTWAVVTEKPGTYFRCVAFLDELRGFAGNIGLDYFPNVTDPTPLYGTGDGGRTWAPVAIDGAPVTGLCALEVVRTPYINAGALDHRVRLVGGGRVGGPAVFVWSDDLGKTWQQSGLGEGCGMVLDVHFVDRRRGFIAAATSAEVQRSHALILATDDGGTTWRPAYTGDRPWELTWKISFPTPDVGYVTVQSYDPDPAASKRYVAKTTDGGRTWAELELADDPKVREFGVAFLDEKTGWIGAAPHGFATDDGGLTWRGASFGNAVNKIRVVRDEAGTSVFSIGVEVYRLVLDGARAK